MNKLQKIFIEDTKAQLPKDFDFKLYLQLNPDLAKYGINDKELAVKHYILFGKQEERSYKFKKLIDVDPDFDENFYAEEYPDTMEYYRLRTDISLKEKLFHHYTFYGKQEGRFKNKIDQDKSFVDTTDIVSNLINTSNLVNPSNKLECICLMTTKKEIENNKLSNFIQHLVTITKPTDISKNLHFKIVINNSKKINISSIKKIFKNIDIINLKLNINDDIYCSKLTENQKLPYYGLKSGPNITFFKSIDICKEYNTTLFLETDCVLNVNWLDKIYLYTQHSNGFLISGATYDGTIFCKAGSTMMNHINGGTALYATNNEILQNIIEMLKIFLHKQIHFNSPGLAYDYALKILIDNNINNYSAPQNTREIWKFINRNYVTNKLIINCSTKADMLLDVNSLLKKYNFAILHKK